MNRDISWNLALKMVISSRKVVSSLLGTKSLSPGPSWGTDVPQTPSPVFRRLSKSPAFRGCHPHFVVFTRSPAEHDKSPTFPDFQIAAWRFWISVDSSLIQLKQITLLLRAQTGIYTSDSNQKNAVTFSKFSLRYTGYNFTLTWTSLVENESQNQRAHFDPPLKSFELLTPISAFPLIRRHDSQAIQLILNQLICLAEQ